VLNFTSTEEQVRVGAWLSCTVTVKLQLVLLPSTSTTEQETIVGPVTNWLPEAGVHVTVGFASQLSVTAGLKLTVASQRPGAVLTTISEQLKTIPPAGPLWTVTLKLQLPVLPPESVAEQVTLVVPRGNVEPDAGTQVMLEGGSGPSTSSVAVTVKLTGAPDGPEQPTTMSAGQVTTGGVISAPQVSPVANIRSRLKSAKAFQGLARGE
jgi:hypothetical protein